MTRTAPFAFLALLIVGLAVGCGDGSEAAGRTGAMEVTAAVTGAPPNPAVAAVRMVVANGTETDDELVAASASVAEHVAIHRSDIDAEGRSTMTEVDTVPIPASGTVTFEPDGLHVMLTGITEPLEPGDTYELNLTFAEAGEVTVSVDVVALADLVADDGTDHGDHATEEQP